MELDCDHVNSGCPTVPGEVDSVATNGEAFAIWVILFRGIIYTYVPICDVLVLGGRDFVAGNECNGIGAFADVRNTLGQATKFGGVRLAP